MKTCFTNLIKFNLKFLNQNSYSKTFAYSPYKFRSFVYNYSFRTIYDLVRKEDQQCYYQILNISPDSTQEEIKKTYYTLAKKYHPDNIPDSANNQTVNINLIYIYRKNLNK